MDSEQGKWRSIADFFTVNNNSSSSSSSNRTSTFMPKSTVPQKRRSPQQLTKTEATSPRKTSPGAHVPTTPAKKRVRQQLSTPTKSPHSPGTLLRQTTLSFRSPAPSNSCPSTPASVRQMVQEIDEQIRAEIAAEKQTVLDKSPTAKFSKVSKTTPNIGGGDGNDDSNGGSSNKVVVVHDSEDDTDSLVSLDELIGIAKKKYTDSKLSSPAKLEKTRQKERIKLLNLFLPPQPTERPGAKRLRELEAQEQAKMFDISKYLDSGADLRERDESMRETRIKYEASKAQLEAERSGNAQQQLLESLLADEGKDEDDVARLVSAISRTEALSAEKTFSFFAGSTSSSLSQEREGNVCLPDYPDADIPMKLWLPGDDDTRSRMFLSGFIAELAAVGKVSDAALSWTFNAVLAERDPYVRSAYVESLKRGSSWWTRTNLSATDIQRCFQTLGASVGSVKSHSPIVARRRPLNAKTFTGEPTTSIISAKTTLLLLDVLDLLQELCLDMDFLALSTLGSIACRLAVDVNLMACSRIPSRVESLLTTLLDLPEKEARLFVADHILSDMNKNLQDPKLQTLLLTHILPTTQTASQLRIRLAHHFLLGNKDTAAAVVQSSLSTPFIINLTTLMKHIATDPSFNTAQPTKLDFTDLRAHTAILDAAISDGGRPALSNSSSKTSFNKSVDALASIVKETFVRISDSGASHMSRTEAKDGLQALYYRLLFAVRTEPQLKRNIFDPKSGRLRDGSDYRDEQKGKEFMHGFLKPRTGAATAVATTKPSLVPPSTPPLQLDDVMSESERAIRR